MSMRPVPSKRVPGTCSPLWKRSTVDGNKDVIPLDETIVKTNRVPREVLNAWDLTLKERNQFDFIDWRAVDAGNDDHAFFRYRGELHYLGDFMRWAAMSTTEAPTWMDQWDGYRADSFSDGLLVRWAEADRVVVGSYYVKSA